MQHFGNFSVAKSSCRKLRNFTLPFAERLLPFILLLGNERLPFRHSRDILYRQATDFLNDSGIFSGNRGQIKQRLQIFAEISRKRKHLIPFCQGKRKFQMLRRLSAASDGKIAKRQIGMDKSWDGRAISLASTFNATSRIPIAL